MTIDFTKPLLNFKGEILTDHRGQNIFAKDIVCGTLSNITDASKEDKLQLSTIVDKVWSAKADMEITPEEATLIRKNIESLPANIFTQLFRMLG